MTNNGGDANPPVDILYLDRPKLSSYASQLYQGTPIQRRISDWFEETRHDIGPHSDMETATSRSAIGEAGLTIPLRLGGSARRDSGSKTLKHGPRREYERREGGDEHTVLETRDNLLFALLEDLRAHGWLREFSSTDQAPGLLEIQGPMSFFDWAAVQHILEGWNDLLTAMQALGGKPDNKALPGKVAATIAKFTKSMGISGFHLDVSPDGYSMSAALATEHLTITREQMMTTFLRDEPILGTLIAYRVPNAKGEVIKSSALRNSLQFGPLMDAFLGQAERVLPLAVYFTIANPPLFRASLSGRAI